MELEAKNQNELDKAIANHINLISNVPGDFEANDKRYIVSVSCIFSLIRASSLGKLNQNEHDRLYDRIIDAIEEACMHIDISGKENENAEGKS